MATFSRTTRGSHPECRKVRLFAAASFSAADRPATLDEVRAWVSGERCPGREREHQRQDHEFERWPRPAEQQEHESERGIHQQDVAIPNQGYMCWRQSRLAARCRMRGHNPGAAGLRPLHLEREAEPEQEGEQRVELPIDEEHDERLRDRATTAVGNCCSRASVSTMSVVSQTRFASSTPDSANPRSTSRIACLSMSEGLKSRHGRRGWTRFDEAARWLPHDVTDHTGWPRERM